MRGLWREVARQGGEQARGGRGEHGAEMGAQGGDQKEVREETGIGPI